MRYINRHLLYFTLLLLLLLSPFRCLLRTALAGKVKQSVASVRPFVSTLSFKPMLAFELEFVCLCVCHDS